MCNLLIVNRLGTMYGAIKNFWSRRECIDNQCDTDAGQEVSDAAAAAAEELAEYMRLIAARPAIPPAPAGQRPEVRLRTYHPIPQRTSGDVVIVTDLATDLRGVGYAVWLAMRGGITAADAAEAVQTCYAVPPRDYAVPPQDLYKLARQSLRVSIPAGYTLPAPARAIYGDGLSAALRAAAAVWWMTHEYTGWLASRRDRAAKYGAITPIGVQGVVFNGGAPDQTAHGAVPLTEREEKALKHWQSIRNSDCWLETQAAFDDRRKIWDDAQAAHKEGVTARATWVARVKAHPIRKMLLFNP